MTQYDLGSALFLLAFGLAGAFEAYKLTLGTPGRPGPGFFPFALAVALCLVSVALAARALWTPGGAASGPRRDPSEAPQTLQWWKALYALLGMLAYALVLETLGFLLATVLLMLFLFSVVQPQRWSVAVAASLGTALGAYLLFHWLGVRLPPSRWPL